MSTFEPNESNVVSLHFSTKRRAVEKEHRRIRASDPQRAKELEGPQCAFCTCYACEAVRMVKAKNDAHICDSCLREMQDLMRPEK